MFILTDGKNYVMKNPMQPDKYIATTSVVQATQFTYKQARALIQKPRAYMKWVKGYQMVNVDTGAESMTGKNYRGNGGVYIGENDVEFDDTILLDIVNEKNSILGLAGWNMEQLSTYENLLNIALSKYDSAISDINHALEEYKVKCNGKKPAAHKMSKLAYLLDEIRDKHKRIKQCMRYVDVMKDSITYKYDISKLKYELSRVEHTEYKARTEFYNVAEDILYG